jgi:hypothetical protein
MIVLYYTLAGEYASSAILDQKVQCLVTTDSIYIYFALYLLELPSASLIVISHNFNLVFRLKSRTTQESSNILLLNYNNAYY